MEFINAFVQQFVLSLVFVALAGVAVFIGITLRKHKNKTEELENTEQKEEAVTE